MQGLIIDAEGRTRFVGRNVLLALALTPLLGASPTGPHAIYQAHARCCVRAAEYSREADPAE
eukprot:CAMPEP_0195093562 /NCGR_PEP_ID=MMETSP0448-20130528/41900_1 /TAXON_ID=66468 /ORGANISM="Heterocapsa triquestra, Strain CCMP 448" /LENGTH=61 /DNA_ID=CAMNT_0040127493 /DNA_START=196 /DNA_END=378 /DNA_ORIENTATION=+